VDRAPVRLRRPIRLLRLAGDDRLVALVRAGDESAFEVLYDRHHPAILGFCRHMLGTREEAEDAVQHTFLAAFRDLTRDDKPIELRPWLFAIARNRCVSLLRARRAHVDIELAEPATDGLAATVERREDVRELLSDLAHLPEDQRAALLLAELGALDHAGIATVLGCPREKVKARVFQARTSLAASREARATPCEEIRLELASATGAALRRGPLRRHLRACDGCRAFKAEIAVQRKLLAVALPVLPTVALKATVLSGGASGASASSGGAAAATGTTAAGAASGASSGTVGGMLGTIASTGAGKLAVSLAVAGVVASGGALTERLEHRSAAAGPAPSWNSPAAETTLGPSSWLVSVSRVPHAAAALGGGVAPALGRSAAGSGLSHALSQQSSPANGHAGPSVGIPGIAHAPAHVTPVDAPGDGRHHGEGTAGQAPTPPSEGPPEQRGRVPADGTPSNGRPPTTAPRGGKPSDPGAPGGTSAPAPKAPGKPDGAGGPSGKQAPNTSSPQASNHAGGDSSHAGAPPASPSASAAESGAPGKASPDAGTPAAGAHGGAGGPGAAHRHGG